VRRVPTSRYDLDKHQGVASFLPLRARNGRFVARRVRLAEPEKRAGAVASPRRRG
jgi:hypothetical protein